jgi:hypothetical protein
MPAARRYHRLAHQLDRLYFGRPDLWPARPFLPLLRLPVGQPTEHGVLYDAVGASGTYGYSSTVFLSNLLTLPATEAELLALPRLVYDTLDELAEDGWVVD